MKLSTARLSVIISTLALLTTFVIWGDKIRESLGINQQDDLSGEWMLKFEIEKSSLKRYIGKSSTFKVHIRMSNKELEANGEMWQVDDQDIPYSQHIPIEIKGVKKGRNFECTYIQYGAIRTTTGSFKARLDQKSGRLVGKYSGTAANTSGPMTGWRISR